MHDCIHILAKYILKVSYCMYLNICMTKIAIHINKYISYDMYSCLFILYTYSFMHLLI